VSDHRPWWLAGIGLGVVFVLLNLVQLAFVEGDGIRDLVGAGLGGVMIVAAGARYRGWGRGA
jgi:hypothetical protein